MVLHLHESAVDVFEIAQYCLPIKGVAVQVLRFASITAVWSAVVTVLPLDVEKWLGRLCITEGDLAQTSLNDKLLILWLSLGSLDSSLNLLLHALHVIVATSVLSSASHAIAAARLEEVRLSKVVGWLVRILTRCPTDLREDLVVEVLIEHRFGSLLVNTTSRRHELLQLNASDKILVLGCHQTVVL